MRAIEAVQSRTMAKPTHLQLADWNELVGVYQDESDRGAAILAGSFVEHALGLFLRSKAHDPKIADQLFGPLGPLSSFSQRIAVAYAFSFIREAQYRDLELVRRTRNHFAHHPLDATFSSPEVVQLASKLSTMEHCPEGRYPESRARWRTTYLLGCGMLAGYYLSTLDPALRPSVFQPDGWHTVTPRIIVRDPANLINFMKAVFDAKGELHPGRPAEIRIGDSIILVSDGDGLREQATAFLYVYVEDADATYSKALTANAVSLEAPADMPYGDRRAMVKDPWGNTWQIATHQRYPRSE
jgi:PhnB protein